MMVRPFFFLAGMPRAGSTLLANILAQNEALHPTATSGLLEMMVQVRNVWDKIPEHQAMTDLESEQAKIRTLRGIMNGYHETDRKYVVDKSRGWLGHIEMLEAVYGQAVKILMPVRDLRDILSSYELLWRRSSATRQTPAENSNYLRMQSLRGRLATWMSLEEPVGLTLSRIRDLPVRGHQEKVLPVRFEELTTKPEVVMAGIYAFLRLEPYGEHDFDNVVQYTEENDRFYGMGDLHTIRSKVEPVPARWPGVLGEMANEYQVSW